MPWSFSEMWNGLRDIFHFAVKPDGMFEIEEGSLGVKVLILGPAGSGKSLLTGRFADYLRGEGYTVAIINLDPGTLHLPYKPDFDIRRHFTIRSIMEAEGLGPNGAMLRAMDRLASTRLPRFDADYILYDTPGQLEPFLFHRAGRRIAAKLGDPCGVYLIDATLPTWSLPGIYLYSIVAQVNLGISAISVITKVDMLPDGRAESIRLALSDPSRLRRFLKRGVLADLGTELIGVIEQFMPAQRIPLVSSITGQGFDELLALLHEFKCTCGDLT